MEVADSDYLIRGVEVPVLNRHKLWEFTATKKPGDQVVVGDILGTIPETKTIEHRIMVPHGVSGKITEIKMGLLLWRK